MTASFSRKTAVASATTEWVRIDNVAYSRDNNDGEDNLKKFGHIESLSNREQSLYQLVYDGAFQSAFDAYERISEPSGLEHVLGGWMALNLCKNLRAVRALRLAIDNGCHAHGILAAAYAALAQSREPGALRREARATLGRGGPQLRINPRGLGRSFTASWASICITRTAPPPAMRC